MLLELGVYALIAMNFVAFAAFGWDKAQAESGGWRVREETLILLAAFGGLGGALAGQQLFRHKTRKASFNASLRGAVAVNVLVVSLGYYALSSGHLLPLSRAGQQDPLLGSEMNSVYYSGCNAVRAAGKAPLRYGEPGYRSDMDGDGDGVACEPYY